MVNTEYTVYTLLDPVIKLDNPNGPATVATFYQRDETMHIWVREFAQHYSKITHLEVFVMAFPENDEEWELCRYVDGDDISE